MNDAVTARSPQPARIEILVNAGRGETRAAQIENGVLRAAVIFPGLPIEYREEGGEWRAYVGPVEVSGVVEVRARSADGSRPGRALRVD